MESKTEKEVTEYPMMDDVMIDIDDHLLFPEEAFSIPDFPSLCDLSTSSSPPLDPPKNPTSPSSSSSSSWNFLPQHPNAVGDLDANFLESFLQEDIQFLEPKTPFPEENGNGNGGDKVDDPSEELGKVFLEWLKDNRDAILPEDLRAIKLKKSTIECAAARLGEGRQGRMQLVKLILAWVQNHHLQRRRNRQQQQQQDQELNESPVVPPPVLENAPANPSPSPNPNLEYVPWPHYTVDPTTGQPGGYYPSFHPMPMPYAQYPMPVQMGPPPSFLYQAPSLSRMTSATKEARRKRMARQRRYSALHRSRSKPYQNSHATTGVQGGTSSAEPISKTGSYALPSSLPPNPSRRRAKSAAENLPSQKRSASCLSENRQSWKSEKNLRFLLQKVLKQSDVGSLGRIVLPKKEAESHLPELDARDGISIPMEDIGTSRLWNMRYRYWPNNKSRMYLLENTGEFVRSNGLQEGDFIVLYSDVKRNKYMIRGVKVRPSLSSDTGKARHKIRNDLEESSRNSMSKATSSSESNDSMMEFFADEEDEDIAS